MAEGLKIGVSADVKQAEAALASLVRDFSKAGDAAEKTGADFAKAFGRAPLQNLEEYSRAINNLKRDAGAVSFRSLAPALNDTLKPLAKLPQTTNQATLALSNLGRVAQDAPFGFLGIANNLNPLLESFQRLKATTGTTGGALKALGASLTGPAGIGIALSVVSSLLIVFGDKLFGASKAAKAMEEANDALAKGTATDLVKLASLVGVITNVNTATRSREQALKDLNKEYGKYLGDLGTEEITLNNIGKAYDKIIDALLRQAVVKGIQAQITAEVEKTAKALLELDQAEQKRQAAVVKATASRAAKEKQETASVDFLKEARDGLNRTTSDGVIADQQANRQVVKGISDLTDYTTQYQRLTDELKRQLNPLLTLTDKYADLGGSFDDKNIKNGTRDILAEAKRIAEYLENNTTFRVTYEFNPLDDKATALRKAQDFLDDVSAGRLTLRPIFDLNFTPPRPEAIQQELTEVERGIRDGIINVPPIEVPVVFTPQEARNAEIIREFQAKFNNLGFGMGAILPEDLKDPSLFNTLNAQFETLQKNIFKATQAADVLGYSFERTFDAILQGENPLKAFFQSLGQSVLQLISQLIAAQIRALILKAIVGGATGGGGALAGALGGLKFASGGIVSGPTLALIGEGMGTSRSNPEVVAPLDQLRAMIGDLGGGGATHVTISGRLRGRDIALGQNRNARSNRRLGARG